jgi:hypothetical protein
MRLILLVVSAWLAGDPVIRDDRVLCAASWEQADGDGDGVLGGREATAYLAMMYLNKAAVPADGRIDRATFVDSCLSGSFRTGYVAD